MGSIGNQNPWVPYNYKDCSEGICSMYCPQWCYIIFPPPPPPPPLPQSNEEFETPFTPLVIVIICILASAFMLVSYYTIVIGYCTHRNNSNVHMELDENSGGTNHDQWHVSSNGLDEALIKSITVFKYNKGDGLIEGIECSVCLSGFEENDSLRLLPNCSHAFHLPCIDTWLKTQANCPLCRANVISTTAVPQSTQDSSDEIQGSADLIVVVVDDHDCESNHEDDVGVSLVGNDMTQPKSPRPLNSNTDKEDSETRNSYIATTTQGKDVRNFTRSYSLSTFLCQNELPIGEITLIGEGDECIKIKKCQSCKETGSSRGFPSEENKSNNSQKLQ